MGWGDCGFDSMGRPIGYVHEATCDEEGCNEDIDRGLSYACGGMHGGSEGCEKYFCGDHLHYVDREKFELTQGQLCRNCLIESEMSMGCDSMDMILDEIKAERERQIGKGYTSENDDEHTGGELGDCAAAYIMAGEPLVYNPPNDAVAVPIEDIGKEIWPIHDLQGNVSGYNPDSDRRFRLIQASALLLAELMRIDRATLGGKAE